MNVLVLMRRDEIGEHVEGVYVDLVTAMNAAEEITPDVPSDRVERWRVVNPRVCHGVNSTGIVVFRIHNHEVRE